MISLVCFILVCLGVGFTGAGVTAEAIPAWYEFLNKPPGTPPNWLFAPVWTTLYLLMGISVWFIWRRRKDVKVNTALALFAAQLGINAAWSPVFFGMRNPGAGLAVILTMWVFIALTIRAFLKVEKRAGFLLVPYMIWVSYAVWLNAGILFLNS